MLDFDAKRLRLVVLDLIERPGPFGGLVKDRSPRDLHTRAPGFARAILRKDAHAALQGIRQSPFLSGLRRLQYRLPDVSALLKDGADTMREALQGLILEADRPVGPIRIAISSIDQQQLRLR